MDRNCHVLEVECSCGETHTLDSVPKCSKNLSAILSLVRNNGVKSVIVLLQPDFLTVDILCMIKVFKSERIKVVVKKFNHKHAEIMWVNSLPVNAELVVAVGDINIFEVGKYYASLIQAKLAFVVGGDFFDFSFSKFARCYNGLNFEFYVCKSPEIIVFDGKSKASVKKIKQYFLCKNLAVFENTRVVYTTKNKFCDEINKAILFFYNKIKREKLTLFELFSICLEISLLMNYFNTTKFFYGAEMATSGIVEALSGECFFEAYLDSVGAINLCYECALSSKLIDHGINLSKRAETVAKVLKISQHQSYCIIKKHEGVGENHKQANYIKALKYYLEGFLETKSKRSIRSSKIISALYVAPEFCFSHLFLRLIRDFGYLEKLLT